MKAPDLIVGADILYEAAEIDSVLATVSYFMVSHTVLTTRKHSRLGSSLDVYWRLKVSLGAHSKAALPSKLSSVGACVSVHVCTLVCMFKCACVYVLSAHVCMHVVHVVSAYGVSVHVRMGCVSVCKCSCVYVVFLCMCTWGTCVYV